MGKLIEFLSGSVPGGIFILLIVLLIVNLTIHFIRRTGLSNKRSAVRNQITFSFAALAVYVSLWLVLRPPQPPVRVIVMPAVTSQNQVELTAGTFYLAEVLQRISGDNFNPKYLWHRWQWLFETVGSDSADDYTIWKRAALAMKPGILIEQIRGSNQKILIHNLENERVSTREYELNSLSSEAIHSFIRSINQEFKFFRTQTVQPELPDTICMDARISLLSRNPDEALRQIGNREDIEADILKAAAYVNKGLKQKIDRAKAAFVPTENDDFIRAKQILARIIREKSDTPEVALLLARMSLREGDFQGMDIYLKKALSDDVTDSRAYFLLSYLLPARLEELGYKTRPEILHRAVFFDPGYRDAVYELANEYYNTGTGTPGGLGTTSALEVITNFLKIKSGDPQILSLLGSIYLRIQKFDEALALFKELNERYPDDADTYYNMGIAYFMQKNYATALTYFEKAIAMNEHLDSFLYAGLTCRMQGNRDKALFYYRERVKRKTGDDDRYAREAMSGIRIILNEIESEKKP